MSTALVEYIDELISYAKDRQHRSLAQMKSDLGDERAIQLEIAYQGRESLNELQSVALIQANRICVALGKPELISWPKGWMDVPYDTNGDCCDQLWPAGAMHSGLAYGNMDYSSCPKCGGREFDPAEYQLTTPLEVALDLVAEDMEDLWVLYTSNGDEITIANHHPSFDIWDIEGHQVITANQAMGRLDGKYGEYEKFAVTLPEELSQFLSHFVDGLYPELVETR